MPKDIHKAYFLNNMAGFTINIQFGLFVVVLFFLIKLTFNM